ncbi:thioesterase [Actinomyces bowdenii]|uniref:Thioesterase n=1 Tax=Actinomyces bowdenii TaxID=131109 RepID=A0A853EIM3_9ACTO|nr:thioesterase [Actinomyces bowdenii]NYS68052.1 thioesterase [Actinomyces bowdenii]
MGKTTLVCLPHAGAGSAAYARWVPLLPPWIRLVAVTLPGRESRSLEPLMTSVEEVINALGPQLADSTEEPFALFGHSLGALLAYELTKWMEVHCAPQPELLILSGRMAPHHVHKGEDLHSLSDARFLTAMQEKYGGIPDLLRNSTELQRLFLPPIRADMEMLEAYRFSHPTRLISSDLLVLGACDDPTTRESGLRAWNDLTVGHATFRTLPSGRHFFAQTRAHEVTQIVAEALAARLTAW